MKDARDPTLVAIEMLARRRPGEPLSVVADRLVGVDIPLYGTPEARAALAGLNGRLDGANAAFAPR